MTKAELRAKAVHLKKTEIYARDLANALLDLIGEYTAVEVDEEERVEDWNDGEPTHYIG